MPIRRPALAEAYCTLWCVQRPQCARVEGLAVLGHAVAHLLDFGSEELEVHEAGQVEHKHQRQYGDDSQA